MSWNSVYHVLECIFKNEVLNILVSDLSERSILCLIHFTFQIVFLWNVNDKRTWASSKTIAWTGKSPTKWFIWIKKKRNVERSFPCTWNICPVIMRTLLISILLLHSIIINTQTRFLSSTHHIQFYALQLSQATNNFEQHKYWMDVTFGQWQWMCFACYLYKAAHSTNQTASIKQANVAWYECTYKRMSVLFVDLLYAKRVCVPYRPLHPASNMV